MGADKINLENARLVITRTHTEELDCICLMEADPENQPFILPYSKGRHLGVINREDEEHLSVWDKERNELIGFIILAGLQNPNLSLELRRMVITIKGKGIGRQCLQLLKDYCFRQLKFHRLWLDVFVDNHRAIRLYESEGFVIEGALRDVVKQDIQYRSLLVLSLLETEYSTAKNLKAGQ